ncbi:MFS transporter, partial [Methanobacterium sp.]|uniref:MFS transporter n=1 Tax=Methanobacterium sp. TaxID=2164 RepID=UPI003C71F356
MKNTNTKLSKNILIFLFTVVLFDLIGATILVTVQAFIVKQYNSTAIAVSLLIVLYAAAQFIAAPILGRISDKYGRRPILLICLLGSALGYFIFGLGGALWVLYLSRIIDGFTGGNVSIAQAYISDVSSEKDRTKNLGFIGVAFGLGFILGPIFGGIFSQLSLNAPAYAAGIFSLAATLIGFYILPESIPKDKRNLT